MVDAKLISQGYKITQTRAQQWAPIFNESLLLADCDTAQRVAYFMAQIGHESGRLRWTNELWGPTKQQLRYECNPAFPWTGARGATNRLAYMLGNNMKGDGARFKGHGGLQTTGRTNHRLCTRHLRVIIGSSVPDFEANPERLAEPRWGMLGSASYWVRHNLNKYSDKSDLVGQTRVINGGLNGLSDRQLLLTQFLGLTLLRGI